jgi:prophage regulatory protein
VKHNDFSPPIPGEPTLLRLPRVKARAGLSRSEIYRRIASGKFPAPVKLGKRASAWQSHEIDKWIADRVAERDSKAAA